MFSVFVQSSAKRLPAGHFTPPTEACQSSTEKKMSLVDSEMSTDFTLKPKRKMPRLHGVCLWLAGCSGDGFDAQHYHKQLSFGGKSTAHVPRSSTASVNSQKEIEEGCSIRRGGGGGGRRETGEQAVFVFVFIQGTMHVYDYHVLLGYERTVWKYEFNYRQQWGLMQAQLGKELIP